MSVRSLLTPKKIITTKKNRGDYWANYYQQHKESKQEYSRKYRAEYYATSKLLREIKKTPLLHTHTHITSPKEKKTIPKKEVRRKTEKIVSTPFFKKLDNPNIRIKIRKETKRPARENWREWKEFLKIKDLTEQGNPVGARTGKKIFTGRASYYFYCFDEDYNSPKRNLTTEQRQRIGEQSKARSETLGLSTNRTRHGRHTYILSKEPIKDLNVYWQDQDGSTYNIADFLGEGRQAVIIGDGKEWEQRKKDFLIVKSKLGLVRKLKHWNYTDKLNEKQQRNIKVYQQEKTQQKPSWNINERIKANIIIIKEKLLKAIRVKPRGKMRDPYLIKTSNRTFYADAYWKEQEIILDYIGESPTLWLSKGHTTTFLHRILNNHE